MLVQKRSRLWLGSHKSTHRFATVKKIASRLGISERRVQQLSREKGMPTLSRGKYDEQQCVLWYAKYANGAPGASDTRVNLWAQSLAEESNRYLMEEICMMYGIDHASMPIMLKNVRRGILLKDFIAFSRSVAIAGGHWMWSIHKKNFYWPSNQQIVTPPRAAWTIYKGQLSSGQSAKQTCSQHRCINPDHLTTYNHNCRPLLDLGIVRHYSKPLLTASEVAHELGMSTYEVQRMIKTGRLPAIQVTQHLMVRRSDIKRFYEGHGK